MKTKNGWGYAMYIACSISLSSTLANTNNISTGADTNSFSVFNTTSPSRQLIVTEPVDDGFWRYYQNKFIDRSDIFEDKFGPLSLREWDMKRRTMGYAFHSEVAKVGRGAMQRALVYSLRETFVDMSGLRAWSKDQGDDLGEFIGDFLESSIAGTAEEQINVTSIAQPAAEETWWKSMRRRNDLRISAKLLRTSPYVALEADLKKTHALLRYRFDAIDAESRLEFFTRTQLSQRYQLIVGMKGDPTRFNDRDNSRYVMAGLSRVIGNPNSGQFVAGHVTANDAGAGVYFDFSCYW